MWWILQPQARVGTRQGPIRMPSGCDPGRARDSWVDAACWSNGVDLSLACHSTYMVLDHAQVDPELMQVDLERRSNFQFAHGGFDL